MKLLALVESEDHVCTRYRLEAFRPMLGRLGHTLMYHPFPKTWRDHWAIGKVLRNADVVIVQRKLPDASLCRNLRNNAKKLIFDFDDAVWMRDSYSVKGMESDKLNRRFQRFVAVCDLIVCGNRYLADHAKRFTHAPIEIIPTCVNLSRYKPAAHTATGKDCRLVWIGSGSTLQGLDRFRDVLEDVGRSVPGITLRLICDQFLQFTHLKTEPIPWSEATEAEALRTADIGLTWIPDDAWSRGKCGLKILQYHAAGLPVIANPVGVHPEMVKPHRTGILATEGHEWIDAVRQLCAYPVTRRDYGMAGRTQTIEHYSTQTGGLLWIAALQKWLKPKRPPTDG